MTEPERNLDHLVGPAEQVREVYEQVPIPMASTAGPGDRLTTSNAAYRALVGLSDVIGRPAEEVFGDVDGEQITALLERAFNSGAEAILHAWRLRVGTDGPGKPVDRYLDLTAAPYRSADGEVAGVHFSAIDVTEEVTRRLAAEELAQRTNREVSHARDVITTLQDALLPTDLPVLPGLDIASRSLLADQDAAAGGDWFDAVVRPDGRVALVVGDVVGHGVAASAVMAQLRAVLHDHLLGPDSIAVALGALDRFARNAHETQGATVCVGEVDPTSGDLEYCTAGHPPPAVVSLSGATRFLEPTGAGPLATHGHFPTMRVSLEPDDLVLLYTDGLVARPGRSASESTVELARVLSDAAASLDPPDAHAVDQVCQQTLERLTRFTGYADDITVLAGQMTAAPPTYRTELPADASSVTTVRTELSRWLVPLGVSALDELAVLYAVAELAANSAEHAYVDSIAPDPQIEIEARLSPRGDLVCWVRDRGTWRSAEPAAGRGRGLGIVRGLVDGLEISRHPTGTTACFRHRLTRSAGLLAGSHGRAGPPVHADPEVPFSVDRDGDLLRVQGSIDVFAADDLRVSLHRHTRGGTQPLTVDLADVTYLGPAGVRVLHEVGVIDGADLHLLAPPGTVAQHVLEQVRLHYATGSE
jgi:serine phosphatase RsbU (regulator of sigma subunit)/anti-sigma regulatory factor (Ser/Thr protein kinase)/anti-anti-sigma regulatory factor